MPIQGRGHVNTNAICFFGTGCFYHPLEKGQALPNIDYSAIRDIVGLTITSGAYVTRPTYTRDMRMWRPTKNGLDFELEIQGEADASGVVGTVNMALAHLGVDEEVKKEDTHLNCTRVDLACPSSVWERFLEMVSSLSPLRLQQ